MKKLMSLSLWAMLFCSTVFTQVTVVSTTPGAGWVASTTIDNIPPPLPDNPSTDGLLANFGHFMTGTGIWTLSPNSPHVVLGNLEFWSVGASTHDPKFSLSVPPTTAVLVEEIAVYSPNNNLGYRDLLNNSSLVHSLFVGLDVYYSTAIISPGSVVSFVLNSPVGTFDMDSGLNVPNLGEQHFVLARDKTLPNIVYVGMEDSPGLLNDNDFQDMVVKVGTPFVPEAETHVTIVALVILVGYGFYRRNSK